VDSTGPVVVSCESGDEPSGSGATVLVFPASTLVLLSELTASNW
jgi:hypothetical protein